jgi:RNA polymerase sigma-B factor
MPRTVTASHGPPDVACRTRRDRHDALLFERYHETRDRRVRAELVARWLPLAKRLARGYSGRDEYDDLVQVASVALLRAVDRYDPGRGIKFSSYAVPTVVGELKRHFRDHCWSVKVPRDVHDRSVQVNRASKQLTAELGRSPTPSELAEALGSSVELVLEALQARSALRPERLDAPHDPEGDERNRAAVASEEPGYAIAEASATLAPLLARLTPTERTMVRLRFGQDLTQSEIAARLGCSQMHVSRRLRAALVYLQQLTVESSTATVGT